MNNFINEFEEYMDSLYNEVMLESYHESFIFNNNEIPSKWYHLVPKGSNINKGLMSPYFMYKTKQIDLLNKSLDKYRDRLVNGWNIYPNKNPEDLTIEEIILGLRKFRGKYGDRYIYTFRYPPTEDLGLKMKNILMFKDIYEIDLSKIKDIISIDFGHVNSNTDMPEVKPDWYLNVSWDDYFKGYKDDGTFFTLNHIAIATKSGRITKDAIRKLNAYDIDKLRKDMEGYTTESKVTSNCLIVSCFAGVGKNYAIEYLRKKGYRVNTIDKLKRFEDQFISNSNYINMINELCKISDVLFIPYFIDMERKHLRGNVNYYLIYPSRQLREEYAKRFRFLGFTDSQINYLIDNWDVLISDCENCKIPNKIRLNNKNQYALDYILPLLTK